jgi:hypothetical protein
LLKFLFLIISSTSTHRTNNSKSLFRASMSFVNDFVFLNNSFSWDIWINKAIGIVILDLILLFCSSHSAQQMLSFSEHYSEGTQTEIFFELIVSMIPARCWFCLPLNNIFCDLNDTFLFIQLFKIK